MTPRRLSPADPVDRSFTPRQERMLADLEAIIVERGFSSLTVAGLAEQLHCSRRTLYEVADSKESLVLLVLDRMLRRVGAAASAAALAEPDRLQRMRAFLLRGLPALRNVTAQFADDIESMPAARDLVGRHYHYAARTLELILEEGQAQGEFVSIHPTVLAEAIRAAAEHLLSSDVLRRGELSYADALEELFTLLARGLSAGTLEDSK